MEKELGTYVGELDIEELHILFDTYEYLDFCYGDNNELYLCELEKPEMGMGGDGE